MRANCLPILLAIGSVCLAVWRVTLVPWPAPARVQAGGMRKDPGQETAGALRSRAALRLTCVVPACYRCGMNDVEQLPRLLPDVTVTLTFTL